MESEKVVPVRVAVRSRPLVSNELIEGCQVCARTFPSNQSIVLGGDKIFTYDYVFGEESSQVQVYDTCVSKLLPKVFAGFNVTILAYGQTGSGKTFTMGTSCSSNGARSEDAGIIPRAVQDIFRHISTNTEKIFLMRVSFLEIYKEDVFDLFSKDSDQESLQIREDQTGAIKISNLTELNVTTPEETIRLLAVGSASRSTASTKMNMRSSRSHAIFTLIIEQQAKSSGGTITVAKFHLVDLAGSEKAGTAKAVGERLKEGVTINQGLLSLGNVISALCDGNSHVPYQNSKLTHLLQDSLGGNSHTVMIACVSPADSNFQETLNTLRYADRARKIKNKPVVNINPMQAEVAQLRQQLQEVMIELIRCRTLGKGGDHSGKNEDDESKKEIALVLSRNAELENENRRLSGELHHALDQLGKSSKRLIITELEVQKLKELVLQLSESIENSQLADGDDQATSLLKDLQNSIMEFSVNKPACEREMTTIEEEGSDDSPADCASEQTAQKTLLNQFRLEVTMRRVALSKDLEQLNRVLQAKEELTSKITLNDQQVMKMQFENWLQDELLVVSESKKLEHHLSSLIEGRKAIAIEINAVEKQLKDLDMAEDRSICNTRIRELKGALKEHCDKIAELQKKILDVDPERHIKNFGSNVTDIVESQAIATSLFEMMNQQQRTITELQKQNERLEARLQQVKRDFELKLTDLNRQHQEEIQELCRSRLQYAHDELKKKREKVEALQRELASVKGNRKEFFKDVSSTKQKAKSKPLSSKTAKRRPQLVSLDELETSVETEFDSDEEYDPDWCLSSELSQRSRSATACKCRRSCRSGRCGCSRKQRSCSSRCLCKRECSVVQCSESDSAVQEEQGAENLQKQH